MAQQDTNHTGRPYDRQRLAVIYDTYHQPIYEYIYRRIGHVDTARELAADVFRALLEAVQQGRSPAISVRAWLYRTAHNLVVDEYRRQTHRQHLDVTTLLLPVADTAADEVEQRLAAETIRRALQTLPPDQQQVVILKFLTGLSNGEVAEILGKSVGAVKALQHRALAALQARLAPPDPTPTVCGRYVHEHV